MYQIAIYDRWTGAYMGILELVGGGPALWDSQAEAEAFAAVSNKTAANLRYEACEHHEAQA